MKKKRNKWKWNDQEEQQKQQQQHNKQTFIPRFILRENKENKSNIKNSEDVKTQVSPHINAATVKFTRIIAILYVLKNENNNKKLNKQKNLQQQQQTQKKIEMKKNWSWISNVNKAKKKWNKK